MGAIARGASQETCGPIGNSGDLFDMLVPPQKSKMATSVYEYLFSELAKSCDVSSNLVLHERLRLNIC